MTGNQIGIKLGQIRKSKGISQSSLAKWSGVHRNTIVRMEMGSGGKLDMMDSIAKALEVRLSDVMRDVEDNPIKMEPLGCRANRSFYAKYMSLSSSQAKAISTEVLIQLANCADDSARRILLGSTCRPKGLKARRQG